MGSYSYPKDVTLLVIVMIQEAKDALNSAAPVVTTSPRAGFALSIAEKCLDVLHQSHGPLEDERCNAGSFSGQIHEPDEVEFARMRLNDASVALIPFTEEACLIWVKQHLERALLEIDEGLENGEFDDDDFDGGIVDLFD